MKRRPSRFPKAQDLKAVNLPFQFGLEITKGLEKEKSEAQCLGRNEVTGLLLQGQSYLYGDLLNS